LNNFPQLTSLNIRTDSSREVKVNGIQEKLYQVVEDTTVGNTYGYNKTARLTVRITVPVFSYFKKEFNKYGRCRLPEEQQRAGSKK